MAPTLDDLFGSPDHYLHSFDGDAALFVPMSRASYHASIFLDGRIRAAAGGVMRVPVPGLIDRPWPAASTGWIFHMAHSGSTLLARALDTEGTNLVLREPLALRQLALAPDGDRLALVAAMLSKRYRCDLPTVVKANVPVNFLLPELVARDPSAAAIFLHSPLRDYLLAILRSADHRAWLRRVTAQLADRLRLPARLSDAQLAAALWLAQTQAFAAALGGLPAGGSLDPERFFAAPAPVMKAVARHLGVTLADAEIDRIVAGPLFSTYSKNPAVAFDNAARLSRRQALEHSLSDELVEAQRWIEATTGKADPHAATIAAAALSTVD